MNTLSKIDNGYYKDAVNYTNGIVKNFGLKKSTRMLSDVIKDLSSRGWAIDNVGQILFFSLCLKYIKENHKK